MGSEEGVETVVFFTAAVAAVRFNDKHSALAKIVFPPRSAKRRGIRLRFKHVLWGGTNVLCLTRVAAAPSVES